MKTFMEILEFGSALSSMTLPMVAGYFTSIVLEKWDARRYARRCKAYTVRLNGTHRRIASFR